MRERESYRPIFTIWIFWTVLPHAPPSPLPEIGTNCILRVEYQNLDDGEWYTDYLTSTWGEFGWAEDYLERITDIANEYRITHWKPINKPKGVEE